MGCEIRPVGKTGKKFAIYCTVSGKRASPFFEKETDIEYYIDQCKTALRTQQYENFGYRFDPRMVPKTLWTQLKKNALFVIAQDEADKSSDEEDYSAQEDIPPLSLDSEYTKQVFERTTMCPKKRKLDEPDEEAVPTAVPPCAREYDDIVNEDFDDHPIPM
jgi:hypothetical protein